MNVPELFRDITIFDEFGNAITSVNMWSSFFEILLPLAAIMTTFLVVGVAVGLIIIMITRSEETTRSTIEYMKRAFQAWLILAFMNVWFEFCFCMAMETSTHW